MTTKNNIFQLLVIINKTAMNIVEHVSLLHAGASSGYMPRSAIAGSSGSTMFNFLRNCQNDFQSGSTSLQSHQKWRSIPFSPHPCHHLLSLEVFNSVILIGVRLYLGVVLFFISLMTKNIEHLFRCFLPCDIPQLRIICLALYPNFNVVI